MINISASARSVYCPIPSNRPWLPSRGTVSRPLTPLTGPRDSSMSGSRSARATGPPRTGSSLDKATGSSMTEWSGNKIQIAKSGKVRDKLSGNSRTATGSVNGNRIVNDRSMNQGSLMKGPWRIGSNSARGQSTQRRGLWS